MKTLLILNDAPYGSDRTYNGVRLAGALAKKTGNEVRIFLVGDAVESAQQLLQPRSDAGFSGRPRRRHRRVRHLCDARGIAAGDLLPGVHRSSPDELTQWNDWADKVLVF